MSVSADIDRPRSLRRLCAGAVNGVCRPRCAAFRPKQIPSAEGAGVAAETTGPRGEIVSTTSADIVEPGNRVAPPKAQQVMRNEELALFSSWVGGHVDRGIRLREPGAPG